MGWELTDVEVELWVQLTAKLTRDMPKDSVLYKALEGISITLTEMVEEHRKHKLIDKDAAPGRIM